jgi:hypothetical protein
MTAVRAALAVCLLLAGFPTAAAEAPPLSVPWRVLRFQAEKLTGRITADVRLEPQPVEPAPPGLWPVVQGEPLRPAGPTVMELAITVTIEPFGMSTLRLAPLKLENRLWFDPVSGLPLRAIRTRMGMDEYVQWLVFGREGVFRRQQEPATPQQAKERPESWTRVNQNVYTLWEDGCPDPIETSMLIVALTDAVARGRLELPPRCVFHKRQLHRLTFRPPKRERAQYAYLEVDADGSLRRAGATDAVTLRIDSAPIGSFRGSVEPWFKNGYLTFSSDGRFPLVVACDLPVVGHVELQLDEIHFR